MFHKLAGLLCIAMAFASIQQANATVLTVHKSSGPYNSVNAALAVAQPNDIIELTDNSSAFTENLFITTNSLTIRGQVGLTPQPSIQGVLAAHPLAASMAAPQKWYWNSGDPDSAYRLFDTKGAVVVNASVGLRLSNLKIKSEPTSSTTGASSSGLLDFRFGTDGLVEDCYLDGSGTSGTEEVAGGDRASLTANQHTFRRCTFYRGNVTLEHEGGLGTLRIEDSLVTGPVHAIYVYGGNAVIENTTISYWRQSGAARVCEIGNLWGNCNVLFRGVDFRKDNRVGGTGDQFGVLNIHDRGATYGADTYASGRWSTGTIELEYDNCDFIGQGTAFAAIMGTTTDRVMWSVKKLKFTDCNFYKICGPFLGATGSVPYPGNHYHGSGVADWSEDYNVFKLTLNAAELSGLNKGEHSVVLDSGQPLYVDVAAGDYRVASNSPAAALNSTGTPVYTGRFGVGPAAPANVVRVVKHSGGDFTSVNEALRAAREGDVVNMADNSAPFVEAIDIVTSIGVTLQGDPTLNPKPVIKGNGAAKPFLMNAAVIHNMTIRDLTIDSTLTSGSNATIFENQKSGTVVRIRNCDLVGTAATVYGLVIDASNLMLENSSVAVGGAAHPTLLKRRTGNILMSTCTLTSDDRVIDIIGGKLKLTNCSLRGGNNSVIVYAGTNTTYQTSSLIDAQNTIIRSVANTGTNPLVKVNTTTQRRMLVFDNCDFVGNGAFTPTAFDVNSVLTYAKFTDSIFYNMPTAAFDFHSTYMTSSTIPGLVFNLPVEGLEDYCAYKQAPNTLVAQGCVRGAHDVDLTGTDQLYSNPAMADYRISPVSPAATLNSTGNPPYAGSQGIGVLSVTAVDNNWTLYE